MRYPKTDTNYKINESFLLDQKRVLTLGKKHVSMAEDSGSDESLLEVKRLTTDGQSQVSQSMKSGTSIVRFDDSQSMAGVSNAMGNSMASLGMAELTES